MSVSDTIDSVETGSRPTRDSTMRFIAKRNLFEAVALECGISTRAVYGWKRVPKARVLDVEKATGRSRRLIRPDLDLSQK
jgi:hypothetical protein